MSWSLCISIYVLFFSAISIESARAPHGGRSALGGRTIASEQEKDFDSKIRFYDVCYGISLDAVRASFERRRVCKAMLLNRLDALFNRSGIETSKKIQFDCLETHLEKDQTAEKRVELLPNREAEVIDQTLKEITQEKHVSYEEDAAARSLCRRLVDCQQSYRGGQLAFRKIWQCATDPSAKHRRLFLDGLLSSFFSTAIDQSRLYSSLTSN